MAKSDGNPDCFPLSNANSGSCPQFHAGKSGRHVPVAPPSMPIVVVVVVEWRFALTLCLLLLLLNMLVLLLLGAAAVHPQSKSAQQCHYASKSC
jgi:hypothetical protein